MKITPAMLQKAQACPEQVALFKAEWPEGATVTLARCQRATEIGLSLDWAAEYLLSSTAREAYEKAVSAAGEAYEEAVFTAREAYEKAASTAGEAYNKSKAVSFFAATQIHDGVAEP